MLTESMHFGEIAILRNVKRTLSVRASSDKLKLLVLSRTAFQRILGSIKDLLKEDYQKASGLEGVQKTHESEEEAKQPPGQLAHIAEDEENEEEAQ